MAPAIATINIMYPRDAESTFDMKYYLSTHMALVASKWGGAGGLQSWRVIEMGADEQYSVQAMLEFESVDKFRAAVASEAGATVFADVANFSNRSPITFIGHEVGNSPSRL